MYFSKMNLFSDTTDYRDILKAYYERRKREMPFYSYRMMGDRIGLDSSHLYRVLRKKQHLPARALEAVKNLVGITGRAAEYFNLLYASNVSKDSAQKESLMERAIALRDVERRALQTAELKVLENWWIPVVRAYLELNCGTDNLRQIASSLCPAISESQAGEAVETLKNAGLVKRLASGKLGLAETHLTVGGAEKAKAVRNFQKQALRLASDSLENVPVEERNVSTLTISVDQSAFDDLKDMLQEFRRLVQKRIDSVKNPDRVMQLSMAFYPVARKK